MPKTWNVYLSGEIHTDWRQRVERGAEQAGLPVSFSAPVTDHPEEFTHALKEVDAAAMAVAQEPEQVVAILRYVMEGKLG